MSKGAGRVLTSLVALGAAIGGGLVVGVFVGRARFEVKCLLRSEFNLLVARKHHASPIARLFSRKRGQGWLRWRTHSVVVVLEEQTLHLGELLHGVALVVAPRLEGAESRIAHCVGLQLSVRGWLSHLPLQFASVATLSGLCLGHPRA